MSRLITKLMSIPVALSLFAVAFSANAQTIPPRAGIQLLTSGLTSPLVASSTGNVVARLVLDTSGSPEGVRISSLPFILSLGGGAAAGTLTNCRVFNESSGAALSPSNSAGLVAGLNSIGLSESLTLPAGTVTTLSLRCDASSSLVTGGNFTFSMNTANVSATGVSTGLPALVYVRGAVPTPVPVPVPVPGVPNTGAGGEVAVNLSLLLGSLGLASLGLFMTKKQVQIR
jgi:hypothetical protein